MMRRLLLVLSILHCSAFISVTGAQPVRQRVSFDNDWRFILADSAQMSRAEYNDNYWRLLNVPHDWAIEGDFYEGNPSGAGGGALPGGVGWYRKTFSLPQSDSAPEKVFLEFDGVYMNSTAM